MRARTADVLVVGAGAAGLVAALAAARAGAEVALACAAPLGQGCNTAVSGGGLMMSTPRYSEAEHEADTLASGCGLGERALVAALAAEANAARDWLEAELGAAFNPKHNGQGVWFEGGGAGLFAALRARLAAPPLPSQVRVAEGVTVCRLVLDGARCRGALGVAGDGSPVAFSAGAVVLATSGYAGLYARHDNPGDPVGDGLCLALDAGAAVRDLEFVQFYPLGLAEPGLPAAMAFRPFPPQARVVNARGQSLTDKHLGGVSLDEAVGAHRDRFSRAIAEEARDGPVRLDLTGADWGNLDRWFSLKHLKRFDFPWETAPARIAPIAHHTMGGLAVDAGGQTTVAGLFAAGEAAGGVHGANRLGSNSLTECLVFGRRAGRQAAAAAAGWPAADGLAAGPTSVGVDPTPVGVPDARLLDELRRRCTRQLGLVRNEAGLRTLLDWCAAARAARGFRARCALRLAQGAALFALRRTESRGAHWRSDHPQTDPAQAVSAFARLTASGWTFVARPRWP